MISRKPSLREVYVWQLPVRIFHWVNAFTITVLIVTGFIIGDPPAIMHGTAPEFNYWFGWVRLAHFIAAFIFVINLAVRIYWAFAGNVFARWNNFSFYSAIGGKVDFNVAGNRTDRVNADYEGFRFQGDIEANTTKSIRDKKAQFSLTCKLGAAYAFVDYLEMYAEPGLAYYFNNGNSEVQNMWKDKPLNFALQVGLRTNF